VVLSDSQLARFERHGFLVLPAVFSPEEVAVLQDAAESVFAEPTPENIREQKSREVRTAMGLHLRNEAFARLVRHPRLLGPAHQLIEGPVYAQQVKVNRKAAFDGESWHWHCDFATHQREDGVPRPLALNLQVFLDDVSDFNGPLYFIPGSQRAGPLPARLDDTSTSYPLWVVERARIRDLVAKHGLVAATGSAGTLLIFGDQMVHASPANVSPWSRRIFSLIVNPVANGATRHDRPDYKHHRDRSPLLALDDDCLLAPLDATRLPA
jgi:ectoine hydroxylase